ncbi:MAG TPA: DNA replication/repair protein RecF [Rhodobacteraceae bacterium]|nr:DNA replication/repair protein RecF [Paracoccaceae bacterium]
MASPAFSRLSVRGVTLSDYRNYARAALQLEGLPVVLTGANGAGKTNLLEALSLFASGRGLRQAPFESLPRTQGDGNWSVGIRLETPRGEIRLGTGQDGRQGPRSRIIRIDGENRRSARLFSEHVRLIWLTPAMDRLMTGPASGRRHFFDRLVISDDPSHARRLNRFERAMRERNRLLEHPGPDASWLAALEVQMAETGTAIAAARREMAARLNAAISRMHVVRSMRVFPRARLHMQGELEDQLDFMAAVDVEDQYRTLLGDSRRRDAAAGRTLAGPHRSELLIRHEPKGVAAAHCSTGEQKALLVAIILGQARLVAQDMNGLPPVLLLDEIAAHLDEVRRQSLFETVTDLGAQAFMTGTDTNLFAPLRKRAQFVMVDDGAFRAG